MNVTFSTHTHFKRKYHSGLKITCVNAMLCFIGEDNNKFLCKDLTADDKYPLREDNTYTANNIDAPNIAVYFSKRLSNYFRIYIYPDVIREIWPMVSSVLRYIYYDDIIWGMKESEKEGNDCYIYDKTNYFELIGKEYTYLKYSGYNPTRIPFKALDKKNL